MISQLTPKVAKPRYPVKLSEQHRETPSAQDMSCVCKARAILAKRSRSVRPQPAQHHSPQCSVGRGRHMSVTVHSAPSAEAGAHTPGSPATKVPWSQAAALVRRGP